MRRFFKPIKDQFMRGLLGGIIAGTVKDIPDLFLVDLFKMKHLAFWDYVGVMIFNRIPHSFIEHFFAFGIEIAFSLGLGIIYSIIIIPAVPTKHCFLRGAVYGSSCWFLLMSIIKLFHISDLLTNDLFTSFATLLFSSGYGLILACIDKLFSPQK